ncbi:MAG TPA: hypothetical protein VF530_07665 [Planctomycetota bacterium]
MSGPEDSAGSTATEAEDAQRQADTHTLLLRMAGRPAGEVLARISDGDMLRLFPRCARRIREACYVLDPERVYERALAEVAVSLEVDGERCAEEAWLSACVDRAVQSVLERDQREEHEGVPSLQPEKHYPLFIEACQLEPGLARLASVRFNALAPRVRRGFQKLVVEGLPLAEVLALDLGPPEQLQLDILHALQAIGLVDEAGVEELRVKGDQP